MKLLQEFQNRYNNITYSLFELESGAKLIHLLNPATVNFDFRLMHKAGNIYEDQTKVQHGTAHLLEHLLTGPNSTFKTKESIHKYEEGNDKKPALMTNAHTGYKCLTFDGFTHEDGTERFLYRIESEIEFSKDKISKELANEKKIVIAERSRQPQTEKDPFLQRLIYLQGKELEEFTYNRIGEIDKIPNISIDDLELFFNSRIIGGIPLFSIQSRALPSKSVIKIIEGLCERYSMKPLADIPNPKLNNKLDIGYYYDDKATGTVLELNYFDKTEPGIDYAKEAKRGILNSMIRRAAFEILREQMGIVYGSESFIENWYTIGHDIKGLKFVVDNTRFGEILDKLDAFIFTDIEKFISSTKGDRWLKHIISKYIFPNTIEYDQNLPYEVGMDYWETGTIYNHNLYTEEVQKLTQDQVIEHLHELQKTPPHIWVESNLPEEEITKTVKQSNLWKRYSK